MSGSHGASITIDRPALHLIRDRGVGAILFIGRVTAPPITPEGDTRPGIDSPRVGPPVESAVGFSALARERGTSRRPGWAGGYASNSSKDGNLNKAHARYLESRLVELANEAKRSEVDNATMPQKPPLSERDTAEAEGLLREMFVIVPVLGLDSFERAQDVASSSTPRVRFVLNERGGHGEGEERSEGFIVFAGARVRRDETPSVGPSIPRLRQSLLSEGVLVEDGNSLRLAADYVFSSPSLAGGVLTGASVDGRTH